MKFLKLVLILVFLLNLNPFIASDLIFGPEIAKSSYAVSISSINTTLEKNTMSEELLKIENKIESNLSVEFFVSKEIDEFVTFDIKGVEIFPKNTSFINFYILGNREGNFSGSIFLRGDIDETLNINLQVVNYSLSPSFLIETYPIKKDYILGEKIRVKSDITKLKPEKLENLNISYFLFDPKSNISYFLYSDVKNISFSLQIINELDIPESLPAGEYLILTHAVYNGRVINIENVILLKTPFLSILLFNFLPVWVLLLFILFIIFSILSYFFFKHQIEKKKKYKMKLDKNKIPKKDPTFIHLGKIAEESVQAYLDPSRLTTHTIIAGATGGGKSISAQVLVEEALMKNIAVIVFDPTAQWSGMLRKCEDKKMMAFYPEFGLSAKDARGFAGNIREVKDAREIIDINKYVEPGHIQIFTLNKLDPSSIDIFIANVIRQVFKSDPKESPDLKILLVFDEVHRLLSKFGGSGEGFLQIERGCREFRKWGIGILLVSQVLSDFVGEIKANISTEIQMRTRDEGDLNRIKIKYGEDFLQSLVKASSGVGMFVNPAYNRANPYFIHFRPILHNTRRLSDEELEKYNKYNDTVEELEYQVEQLGAEKIDTFDLKMELKLVKDKIMVGNFSVVDIYLEGLSPRIAKQWEKLGKKPKKKQIQLADLKEIKASVEEAKKEREKIEKEEKLKNKKQEIKEEKLPENLDEKIINPLTFDNGIMVSSLKELKSVLPMLDEEIFKIHVNENKNEIASWLEQISKPDAEKLKQIIDKKELIAKVETFGKDREKKSESTKEQKEKV